MYDILIIGSGVSGASCAYMLSRYDLKIAVLDKSNDVANGTTKANSAIIHAGYDPAPGTLMARLNVRGVELAKEITENPLYGRIICRCETISEGEIVAALHAPIPPTTLNGVKRRVGSGMGRCQGGFCTPKIHEIITRELGLDMLDICLEEPGSEILKYRSKDNEEYNK